MFKKLCYKEFNIAPVQIRNPRLIVLLFMLPGLLTTIAYVLLTNLTLFESTPKTILH